MEADLRARTDPGRAGLVVNVRRSHPIEIGFVAAWQLLAGGLLVGYGARLGDGCTSEHGMCGLGALQWPSLLAVLTCIATAFLTGNLMLAWHA